MNSRNKLGIRSAVLKSDNELEKLKKENAALKKKLEESSKSKMSEAERNRLLEDPRKEAASNACVLEAQLKDALEKNQQWLVYDQQREAYVQGLMARIFDLEKQVTNAKQTEEKAKDSNSDVISATEEKQKYYDRLLLTAKKDLEGERQITGQLNSELSAMRMKYEDKKREVGDLSTALKSLRETERQRRDDDRKLYKEKMQKLKNELDVYREKLEEEKVKNAELLNQVELIQKSILRQNEDQKRVAALEEQIQRCTSDLENEKIDRHSVQHQLYKVLKELRKTREQITKLEPVKRDICYVDASSNFVSEFSDKLKVREEHQSPRHNSLLDESFLECPRCRAVYPASQHRELLAHIDFCTS
ncbi:centrosomal protein of 55 kDa isoform X4 [Pseudophryne corroboree]|uniref:centrosomal protein of 55 kDa isoform X4 n=1 Tax=Pseudophryne corroboree TaxID=495146 RepID=UPI003081B4FD